jgi:N-acetylglucosaminyldiphosphoundecaprenol N-acetyl-beta-D-mannosaminyltransferase
MITPDGMPVVWVARFKSKKDVKRTYGPDLMLKFCALGQDYHIRHYFFGGTEESNKKLINNLKEKFPVVNIVGSCVPGIRAINQQEEMTVISAINEAQPDILWIGLGSPKQDYWMANHRKILNVPVMVGVGAAFDFIAGVKKQAPLWMRERGLEWLFRLWVEPRRLWKRYLVGNSMFLWLLIRDILNLRRIRK